MTPFIVVWSLMGALGALFCLEVLGGPESLPAFNPLTIKGLLRLLVACAIGATGGVLAGLLIQGENAVSGDFHSIGGNFGAALGIFLAPFTVFGLYHGLEYRLRRSGALRSSLGWRLMGSAGWMTVLVAPALGFVVGEHLGQALGSADFVLSNLLAPFTLGAFILIIPLLFWLIGRADSCYQWTSDIPPSVPDPDPGRVESLAGD